MSHVPIEPDINNKEILRSIATDDAYFGWQTKWSIFITG